MATSAPPVGVQTKSTAKETPCTQPGSTQHEPEPTYKRGTRVLPGNPQAIPADPDGGNARRFLPLHRKLAIGATNDPVEAEADRVASQVMRAPGSSLSLSVPAPALRCKSASESNGMAAPPIVHRVLESPGQALDSQTRMTMESGFNLDFSGVRVHNDTLAQQSARDVNALAYAVGDHIVFGAGQFRPNTDSGNKLIAHELAHVAQASGGQLSVLRRQPDKKKDDRQTVAIDVSGAGQEFSYFSYGREGAPLPFPDTDEMRKELLWVEGPSAKLDPDVVNESTIQLIGKPDTPGTKFRFTHPDLGHILDVVFEGRSTFENGVSYLDFHLETFWTPSGPGAKGNAGGASGGGSRKSGDASKAGMDPQGRPVKPPEELLSPDSKQPSTDPRETMRLYRLILEHFEVKFGKDGADLVKFGRFVERNKGKIDGILQSSKNGKGISEEEIQQIVDMYGKFIASEKDDVPEDPQSADDFNKVFKYDPNWQKMSKQDRQMLIDYAKMNPDDIKEGKLEFSRLSQDMKEEMALKLVDSWAAEIAEAAKTAFTDPGFIISLVLTIAIYIGLWLTPDPTLVTKIAAGTLTAVMWAMFAWEDIWKTMTEYSAFEENVRRARTVKELKAAGNRMAKKIGSVGFDILMIVATWGLGKAAGPKLKGLRTKAAGRGVVRAEANLNAAAADPAAGIPKPAEGAAKTLLTDTSGTTPSALLDALEPKLSDPAKKGLQALRNKAGDMGTYKSLKSRSAKGLDLDHYLSEIGASPAEAQAAKAKLLDAEAKLARAKLIEAETIADPKLRKAKRDVLINEISQRLKTRIKEMGLLKDLKVQNAWKENNLKDLTGALGEALSRQQLTTEVSAAGNKRVVSNLAVVEDGPNYKTIAEWVAAEKPPDSERVKVFQGKDRLYRSLGEIDSMVVEETAAGKPKASVIEEVKTGANDQPVKALEQVTKKVIPNLQRIASGDKSVHVFDLLGKKELGSEQTGNYDFSGTIEAQTRGPEGKQFDNSLGFNAEVLEATAKSLIEDGMPPETGPSMPTPVVLPDRQHDKADNATQ